LEIERRKNFSVNEDTEKTQKLRKASAINSFKLLGLLKKRKSKNVASHSSAILNKKGNEYNNLRPFHREIANSTDFTVENSLDADASAAKDQFQYEATANTYFCQVSEEKRFEAVRLEPTIFDQSKEIAKLEQGPMCLKPKISDYKLIISKIRNYLQNS